MSNDKTTSEQPPIESEPEGHSYSATNGWALELTEVNGEKCVSKCPVFTIRHAQRIHEWREVVGCTMSRCAELAEEVFGKPWCDSVLHYSGKELGLVHTLGHRLITLGIACLEDQAWYDSECDCPV